MGFFFQHASTKKLDGVRVHLERMGYLHVGMLGQQDGVLWLHLERVEQLSADELFQRCMELERLGADAQVELDGLR